MARADMRSTRRDPGGQRVSRVFAALGDRSRLALLAKLGSGESLSIAQLTEGTLVSRQATTKQLGVLARARLVRSVRRGRERLWTIEPKTLDEAQRGLKALSARWDAALARLQAFVESD